VGVRVGSGVLVNVGVVVGVDVGVLEYVGVILNVGVRVGVVLKVLVTQALTPHGSCPEAASIVPLVSVTSQTCFQTPADT